MIGHGTFCIVVVYNNVIARLRRMQRSLEEASMDLGADGWQTFRYVLLPHLSTALVAGGLLAFALSFDEVIVTFFTSGSLNTLPDLDPWQSAERAARPRGERRGDARDPDHGRAGLPRPAPDAGLRRRRPTLTRRMSRRLAAATCALALALTTAACGGGGGSSSSPAATSPVSANGLPAPEGVVRVLAREGYTEDSWIIPFQDQTGCRVDVHYLGPGDDTQALLSQGSYDVVTLASEDLPAFAAARIIRPIDPTLRPALQDAAARGCAASRRSSAAARCSACRSSGARTC